MIHNYMMQVWSDESISVIIMATPESNDTYNYGMVDILPVFIVQQSEFTEYV